METQSTNRASEEQKFMATAEAAEALCAHPATLRRWAKTGVLPHYRTAGGQFRFDVGTYLARVARDPRAAA
jgi:excisionase family DNA binding protein